MLLGSTPSGGSPSPGGGKSGVVAAIAAVLAVLVGVGAIVATDVGGSFMAKPVELEISSDAAADSFYRELVSYPESYRSRYLAQGRVDLDLEIDGGQVVRTVVRSRTRPDGRHIPPSVTIRTTACPNGGGRSTNATIFLYEVDESSFGLRNGRDVYVDGLFEVARIESGVTTEGEPKCWVDLRRKV